MAKVHHRACNLCEAICGLEISVGDDGRIASIRGDEKDPLSRGHICPKAVALKDIHEDPDRLRHPQLRQSDGSWKRIPWDEAFDLAASRIREVQQKHGNDAVAVYSGNPTVHNYGSLLYGPPLLARPAHPPPLFGHLGRPAAAPPGFLLDARPPAAAAGARSRGDRAPAGLRRQSRGLERQHDDRARRQETAQGDPRPRRPR